MVVLAAKEKGSHSSQYCFIHHLCRAVDHQQNLYLENHLLSLHCFYATLSSKFKNPFRHCKLPQPVRALSIYKPMT